MKPILFKIGAFSVYSYGLMFAIAYLVAILWLRYEAKRKEFDPDKIINISILALLFSIIGARITYVIFDWKYYIENPLKMLNLREGGLSFYGGMILGAIATFIFSKRYKIPFLSLLDIGAPAIAIGYSISRIGCFLNGCCKGIDRHPTQIYSIGYSLIIFLILLKIRKYKEKRNLFDGYVFLMYLMLYPFFRFIVEFFREQNLPLVFGKLSVAQVTSVIIFIFALITMIVYLKKLNRYDRRNM